VGGEQGQLDAQAVLAFCPMKKLEPGQGVLTG